jgi:hypothetical protein
MHHHELADSDRRVVYRSHVQFILVQVFLLEMLWPTLVPA